MKKRNILISIIGVIAAIFVLNVIMTAIGFTKKYDEKYVSELMSEQEEQFTDLTAAKDEYAKHEAEKASLTKEIADIQEKLNTISEFEINQAAYEAELQQLCTQIESLSAQKAQKEQTLIGINQEISKY